LAEYPLYSPTTMGLLPNPWPSNQVSTLYTPRAARAPGLDSDPAW
jgi:hypothetical protein